jgi:hypothetical protein
LKKKLQDKVAVNPKFRAALLKDAKGTIAAEWGINVRKDINIVVHENSPDTVHLVIPPAGTNYGELTDEEVEAIAGGRLGAWSCACGPSIG